MRRITFASSMFLFVLVAKTSVVHAQQPTTATPSAADLAARRMLIEDAERARAQNNHTQALNLALRASSIQMSVTLRLFLAQEQNAVGQIAEAYGNADQCVREAPTISNPRSQRQVLTTCQALVELLRPRIGRITVSPTPAPTGLEVRINGTVLNPVFYGVPYTITPGRVVVEAQAPGFEPLHREFQSQAGNNTDVPLTLVAIPQTPTPQQTPAQTTPVPDPPRENPPPERRDPPPDERREEHRDPPPETPRGPGIGPWIVIGTGAAVALASIPFFVLRDGTAAQCRPSTPGVVDCDDPALVDQGNLYQTLAFASVGVGSAAVAGGVVWLIVGNVSAANARRNAQATWMPTLEPTSGGAVLGARIRF